LATLAAPGISATARSRTDVTDHDLVEAVRAGDDHAFERLYERYQRRIATYIFGMVRDRGRAEDLTQEVFVSALRRMRQTDRPILFKPWIYEIAKNACIDAFRRTRRTDEVSIDAELEAGGGGEAARLAAPPAAVPDAAIEGKERLENLWGAFDGLSDAHHQVLVMRELEGLSYAEIGERLGMSKASVESTLFRARRRLTEEFEELQTGAAWARGLGGNAGARQGAAAPGRRDQRRVGQHISRCQPCRREAVMAGLDAAVMARRPIRTKLGALLPLPAFLKRRWLESGADAQVAHWSATASSYGDAPATWLKAVAAVAAVAVAGAGAGTAVKGDADARDGAPAHGGAADADRAGASGAGGAAGAGGSSAAPSAGAGMQPRKPGGRAFVVRSAGREKSTGLAGRSGAGRGADRAGGGGAASGGGTAGTGGSGAGSATGSRPSGGSSTSSGSATTTPSGASQPLIQPNPSALTEPSSGGAPTTVGEAVEDTTDRVGGTVGGAVGGAVQQTGTVVGSTADQVTTTATDTVRGTVGAVDNTVQGVTEGATRTVQTTAQTTAQAVDDVTGTLGGVVGGLGGR
jgi:RNA polymerase sigma factor (sigma-70 family)